MSVFGLMEGRTTWTGVGGCGANKGAGCMRGGLAGGGGWGSLYWGAI